MANSTESCSGVQELIDKLKNQGVLEGKKQADQIIKDAQKEASRIISKAKSDADNLFTETHLKIEVERTSAHDAIKNAFRDSELTLRSKFREAFSIYLKRLVSFELQDKEFIKQLVLVVAGLKTPEVIQAKNIEILLPSKVFEIDEEGKKKLQHLVLGITTEMLREGVELKLSSNLKGGVRIHLVGEDINIDLTDEALSDLLLNYLLPRYREIVSGQELK